MTKYEFDYLLLTSIALGLGLVNAILFVIFWFRDKKINKHDRRDKFYQQLINNFPTHNWKLLENLDKIEHDLYMDETAEMHNPKELAKRILLLDRLNFLFQIYLHKDLLDKNEIESWASWTTSWFTLSTKQLKIVFNSGDLYPLGFISWIKNELLKDEKVEEIFGEVLKNRLTKIKSK